MAITNISLEKQKQLQEEEEIRRRLAMTRTGIRPSPQQQRQIDFYGNNNWASGYAGWGNPSMVYVPTATQNQDIENIGNIPQVNYVATDWDKLTPAQQEAWYKQSRNRLQYAPGEDPSMLGSVTGKFGVNPAYFSSDPTARSTQIKALTNAESMQPLIAASQEGRPVWTAPGFEDVLAQRGQSAFDNYLQALNQIQMNYMMSQKGASGQYKGWTDEAYMAEAFGMVKDASGKYVKRAGTTGTGGGGNSDNPTGLGGEFTAGSGAGLGYAYQPNFKNAFTVGIPNWFFGLPTSSAELASKSAGGGFGYSNIAPAMSAAPVEATNGATPVTNPFGENIFFNMPQNKYTQTLSEFFPTENIPYSSYIQGERPDVAYGEQDVFVGGDGTGVTYQGGYGMSNRMPAPISAQMLRNQQQELLSGSNTSVLPALSQYIEQNHGLPWDTYLNYVSDAYWGKPGKRVNMRAYNQR